MWIYCFFFVLGKFAFFLFFFNEVLVTDQENYLTFQSYLWRIHEFFFPVFAEFVSRSVVGYNNPRLIQSFWRSIKGLVSFCLSFMQRLWFEVFKIDSCMFSSWFLEWDYAACRVRLNRCRSVILQASSGRLKAKWLPNFVTSLEGITDLNK